VVFKAGWYIKQDSSFKKKDRYIFIVAMSSLVSVANGKVGTMFRTSLAIVATHSNLPCIWLRVDGINEISFGSRC